MKIIFEKENAEHYSIEEKIKAVQPFMNYKDIMVLCDCSKATACKIKRLILQSYPQARVCFSTEIVKKEFVFKYLELDEHELSSIFKEQMDARSIVYNQNKKELELEMEAEAFEIAKEYRKNRNGGNAYDGNPNTNPNIQ